MDLNNESNHELEKRLESRGYASALIAKEAVKELTERAMRGDQEALHILAERERRHREKMHVTTVITFRFRLGH